MKPTDRPVDQPTPERPFDADELLGRILTEPSFPAQILIVAARLMASSTDPINPWTLHQRLTTAEDAICGILPDPVRTDASSRARAALPPLGGAPQWQYATTLREIAGSL
ncbi:hypothetical protein [Streptomyces sp. NPDC050504]|uniref:hypothetical protein n=1 Tax=Streptomyces sp. NPDC050504 TaxID=3365618 RepID=UPI00378E7E2A